MNKAVLFLIDDSNNIMNKAEDFKNMYLNRYVSFEIHSIMAGQMEDVLKVLNKLQINCTIKTDFKNKLIKFIICLDDYNELQIFYLKVFLEREDLYDIFYFSH
jgi:hypothetical protein